MPVIRHQPEPRPLPRELPRVRPSLGVDFDGVIHSYTTPHVAAHIIPDPPVIEQGTDRNAIEWLWDMQLDYEVFIFTTRGLTWRGRRAIRKWLKLWASKEVRPGFNYWDKYGVQGISRIQVTAKKLPALMYVDDRAFRFTGDNFPSAQRVRGMRPWVKNL